MRIVATQSAIVTDKVLMCTPPLGLGTASRGHSPGRPYNVNSRPAPCGRSCPLPAAATRSAVRFALPTANHVFLPGHRIMVQVQPTWFPIYDRNQQTYV